MLDSTHHVGPKYSESVLSVQISVTGKGGCVETEQRVDPTKLTFGIPLAAVGTRSLIEFARPRSGVMQGGTCGWYNL